MGDDGEWNDKIGHCVDERQLAQSFSAARKIAVLQCLGRSGMLRTAKASARLKEISGLTEEDTKTARKSWRTKLLAAVGGVSAALLSLGYSVSQQKVATAVPQVDVGTPISAGRWTLSVLKAQVTSELPNGLAVSPDKRALVVEMSLENISSESSNLYGDLLVLSDIPDLPKPDFYLLRDRSILWDLQPRMPETVAAVWEVPVDLRLPETLTVHVQGAAFKPRDNLYAAPGWFPTGNVAEVVFPLSEVVSGDGN